jgi:sugar-specific transcriptional regulator TrmB
MEVLSLLKQLGLSPALSEAYLALVKRGTAEARQLAADLGWKRTTIYAVLDQLCEQGYASLQIGKTKRFYTAESPQRVRLMHEKRLGQFNALIPWLESIRSSPQPLQGIRYFETRKELETWYLRKLEEYGGRSYSIIGNQKDWQKIHSAFLERVYQALKEKRIKVRLLFSADSPEPSKNYKEGSERTIRYLPKGYEFRTTIDIFDEEVLLVSPELRAVAVLISIPAMRDVFDALFRMLWDGKRTRG